MPTVEIPFGGKTVSVEIPEGCLGAVVGPRRVPPAPDPVGEIESALARPIGTPPLEKLLRPGRKAAVIIDDITRKTPTALMLPPVLNLLTSAGIPPADITIVIALGTHRPMTEEEVLYKIGPEVARLYPVVNVPARDEAQMVSIGTSPMGIPVRVNRTVAEADIRIGLGMIVPHQDVGYGGGGKIIFPGVCSAETIEAFHARTAPITTNQLGVVESPLRIDLEAFVSEHIPLDFIVNAVLTHGNALYRCVAGDACRAHRAGIKYAMEVYGVPFERKYPVVIASACPYEIDLWQATKALASGAMMTEDKGTLILAAACPEGIGPHPLFAQYMGMGLEELLDALNLGEVESPAAAAEAVAVCRMKERIRVAVVSPGITEREARTMGMEYFASLEMAINIVLERYEGRKIGVLTHGGTTLPIL
ncbi:MAG: nickel-dependent lactate racemase [Deltaproteobacteria bacterium]|nr:nickel-dependent lactate racemase [Deltaproteobacteria bacterium]